MKIAMVVPEYPPYEIGGGGLAFECLALGYASQGHQVKVFAGWDSVRSWREGPSEEVRRGMPVVRYPLIPLGNGRPFLRSIPPPSPPALVGLRRSLREWNPDGAHLHGYGHALVDLAARFLGRQQVPFVFTIHGLPRTPTQKAVPIRAGYLLYRSWGPGWTLAHATEVTAVSNAIAREVRPTTRVTVIPNGLVRLPPVSLDGAMDLRRRLDLAENVPVIAAAGRLAWSKGFDVLIEAFARLPMSRAACVVAGADAGEYGRLKASGQQCREGLDLLLPGPMGRDELANLLSIASVVVVPSRDEPFGLIALEALASGRRVVATRVGGLPDFLRPPVAELVPPEDAAALAEAVLRALARGSLTPAELQVAEGILKEHAWTQIAGRYTSVLKDAVDCSKAGHSTTIRHLTWRKRG